MNDTGNKFKKELGFTIACIIIYFVGMILANIISNIVIRIPDLANAVFEVIFVLVLIVFLKKNNMLSYYGLGKLRELNAKKLLYYIPMILIAFSNLWFGISINYPVLQLIFISVAMLGVGFSEEILFRSFLMRTIMNKNEKAAIVLSSVIFGVFHIANLFGGANLLLTILQIIYATAFGFMCAVFFYKTANIIPCMICHSLTNITNTFMPENLSIVDNYIGCIVFIILSAFYGIYLLKTEKQHSVRAYRKH